MRFAGTSILVVGFLFCISITWAAAGFLAMGLGLIFLLIAEQQKRLASGLEKAEILPTPIDPPKPETGPIQAANDDIRPEATVCEMDEWSSFVANDEDLSRLVKILAPFGQKYVNQLAIAYVAFNDKAHLPMIVNEIIASARRDAGTCVGDLSADNSNAIQTGQSAADSSRPNLRRSLAAADTSFASEGGMDDGSLHEKASREGPKTNASDEVCTDATARLSARGSVSQRKTIDEADNLKDLFDKLDLSSGNR